MAALVHVLRPALASLVLPTSSSEAFADGPAQAEVSTCFSPGPTSCAEVIADAIDAPRSSIRVQAYWFTSRPILRALAAARRRGVDVAVILDKTQDHHDRPGAVYTAPPISPMLAFPSGSMRTLP